MKNIEVLIPEVEAEFGEIRMAERTMELNGSVVGFLWNSKPNGDLLLRKLEYLFRKQFRLSNTVMRKKPLPSSKAPEDILEELSSKCSFVLLAIGD